MTQISNPAAMGCPFRVTRRVSGRAPSPALHHAGAISPGDAFALLLWKAADIDNVRWLERPDEGLNPGHHGEETGPAIIFTASRIRVIAGDRNLLAGRR